METNIHTQIKNHAWALVLLLLVFSNVAKAKTVTWTGAVSNIWSNSANWSSPAWAGVPSASDDILIPNSANQPLMDMDVIVSSIVIDGKGKDAILKLDGIHSLTVTGNITITNNQTDKILTYSSMLTISNGGNLSGAGEIDLTGNGKLFISGDLRISNIVAGKTTGSKVVFNGTSQTIDNGKEYHFNDLDIQQGYTTLIHTNLRIDGNLIGGGTLGGENNKIQLAGDMMLVDYKPGTSTFELASGEFGVPAVQQLNANSFYILENYDQKTVLTGRVKIIHQVDFEKGNIYLGYHNIYISERATLTRGADAQLSQVQQGSKGYLIANGKGSVKLTDHFLSLKATGRELDRNIAAEIGLASGE